MLHSIDSKKWRPLPSPLAIQKQYFIDYILNPRPGHVKFEVAQKVCMDVLKTSKKSCFLKCTYPSFFDILGTAGAVTL